MTSSALNLNLFTVSHIFILFFEKSLIHCINNEVGSSLFGSDFKVYICVHCWE